MKDFFVADAAQHENKTVVSFFAVTSKQLRSKRESGEYLALSLADKSGQLDARMWENFEKCVGEFQPGDIVKAQALVCRFGDKLQLKIERLRRANADEYALADFVPHTDRDIDDLWAELNSFVDSFNDPHLFALSRSFLDDPTYSQQLKEAPAAKGLHHAYIGGLLEHVVSVLGLCEAVAAHYGDVHRDLLMAGAIFHDIGKLEELSWGSSFDYTLEGQLLGHITIGVGLLERLTREIPGFPLQLRVLLEHMILSHHGKYEFGSPKLPMTREALLLHFIDDMDAKMQTMKSELARAVASGKGAGHVTDWVRSLERPVLDTRGYLATAQVSKAPENSVVKEDEPDAIPFEDRA